jgi:hypothetical protein
LMMLRAASAAAPATQPPCRTVNLFSNRWAISMLLSWDWARWAALRCGSWASAA